MNAAKRLLLGSLAAWAPALPAGAAALPPYADPPMPALRVDAEGFQATERDVEAVCISAGRELWRFFPDYHIEPLLVARSHEGPIVWYRRNDRGEIVVRLDTGNTYWCQYAYQFAHEFCHVLCGFDEDDQANKWFEETLCETASLYVIRAMARAWADDPPYAHWKDFRHALRKYADEVIDRRDEVMEIYADGLKGFYRAHREQLQREPCRRELNGAMALVLLRLFERQPEHWEAVRWLNSTPSPPGETFPQYLEKWRHAVPERHRAFVRQIAELYGVEMVE